MSKKVKEKKTGGKFMPDKDTMSITVDDVTEFRITQWFIPGTNHGHVNWVLVRAGDVIKCGMSMGMPPERLTSVAIQEIIKRGLESHDLEMESLKKLRDEYRKGDKS